MPVVVGDDNPLAIESGSSWNGFDTAGAPVIVTFSFPTSLPIYDSSIGGFNASTISSFSSFTAAEQAQAIQALAEWAAASGIIFVQAPAGQQGDITFANVNFSDTTTTSENGNYQNAAGIGFYPFGGWSYFTGNTTSGFGFTSDLSSAGAVFMNSQDISDPDGIAAHGTVNLGTLLHEIGHAIGLKHPDQTVYDPNGGIHDDVLASSADASTLTIMAEAGDTSTASPTLFPLDKAAAAALYGPAGTGEVITNSASNSLTTWSWDANAGTLTQTPVSGGSTSGVNSVSTWTLDPVSATLTQTAAAATDTIHGTSMDDVIYGYDYNGTKPTSGVISMFGLDGTNTLYAGSGTTSLYGGPGTNTLVGGAGDDSFYVYNNQTTVTDAHTTGNNTLFAIGVSYVLPVNVDRIELFGSGLTATGNNQGDTFYDDPSGSTLIGGAGNDIFNVSNVATTVIESPNGGDDTVFASVNYTVPENVETLTLSRPGLTATGNDQNDHMFADASGSTLIAGSGNDYIAGGVGNDTIVAGAGHDQLFGGGGNDTFIFKSTADATINTTIGDFISGQDKIDLSGIATSAGELLTFSNSGTFTLVAGQVIADRITGNEVVLEGDLKGDGNASFQITVYGASGAAPNIQATDLILSAMTCFRSGTCIATDRGEVCVDQLSIGDRVVTAGGELRPIVWIGHRRIDINRHPDPEAVWPVRVRANAFGRGQPRRDLWLSPEHAVSVAGRLIPIGRLINGGAIQQERVDHVVYWHVELESHDVLLAEGLATESYLDCDNRRCFDNAGDTVAALHPDWRSVASDRPFASPRFTAALRAELAGRSAELGYAAEMQTYAAERDARLCVARTNFVRNPRGEGAVVGEIGAAGQAPTFWRLDAPEGLEIEVRGTGEEGGLPFVDLRFAGRAVAAGDCRVYVEPGPAAAVRCGQDWTVSCHLRRLAGGFAGVEAFNLYIDELAADGAYLTGAAYLQPAPAPDDLALQRAAATRRLLSPGVAAMTAYLQMPVAAGAEIDFTLRLAGFQIEQGRYASNLMLPPPGALGRTSRGPQLDAVAGEARAA
jgi:Ca2+-binding RTX toxin-like protein